MIINQGLQSRTVKLVTSNKKMLECMTPPWGALPYMGYIGMCSPNGYGFSAVLVINRVSILADYGHLGHKKVWFLHSSFHMGMFLKSHFFVFEKRINKSPSQIMFMVILHWSELGNLL